jgi:hypothetical protein
MAMRIKRITHKLANKKIYAKVNNLHFLSLCATFLCQFVCVRKLGRCEKYSLIIARGFNGDEKSLNELWRFLLA